MTDDPYDCTHDQRARMKQLEQLFLPFKLLDGQLYRNLIDGSSDKDQVLKLAQELGELSDSVCKGNDIKDDIGDMLVVMLNIVERNGVSLSLCLEQAYNDIKDRKGRMIDGIFIKENDK